MNEQATLFKSVSEAMQAVERIPKNGFNTFHNYKFATEADVSDALRKELSSRDVAVFVSSRIVDVKEWQTPKGKPTLLTNVECTVTFGCGKTGAQFSITACGTGDDSSDKGTYKAITGAVKYALLKTFLVPTGDDPENDHPGTSNGASGNAPTQSKAAAPTQSNTGEYVFPFGKHKGKPLTDVPDDYLTWLLGQPAKEGYEKQHAEAHSMYRTELTRREAPDEITF